MTIKNPIMGQGYTFVSEYRPLAISSIQDLSTKGNSFLSLLFYDFCDF